MLQLYMVTVPGVDVKSDWLPVHDLLLDEFSDITDVLATTIPETLLIVYRGRADIDAWLTGLDEAVSVGTSTRLAGPHRASVLDRSTDPSAEQPIQTERNQT